MLNLHNLALVASLRPALDAGREYQDLTFGDPAPYGRLDLSFLGAIGSISLSGSIPSAASVLSDLEDAFGVGNVEATDIENGWRLKFVGDLDLFDIPEATLDDDRLSDGTGTAPTKSSQRNYAAAVAAVKEKFTITAGADPSVSVTLSNGGTIAYDNAGNITSISVAGYSVLMGGTGQASVQLEKDATGDTTDVTISSGPGSIGTDVQGTNDTAAVAEVWTWTVGGGSGTLTTTQGASIDVTDGAITAVTPPSGCSVTSGGVGFSSVQFTAPSGARADDSVSFDPTGGASVFVNTQGVDFAAGQKERFTYTTGGPTSSVNVISVNGGTIGMSSDNGTIAAVDTPSGFTLIAGGVGDSFAQFEANSGGAVTDAAVVSGTCSVATDVQGAAGSAEVLGQCVIGFIGAAGYFTFADGFTALAVPVTWTGAAIKSLLNGASAYNAVKVDAVTVGTTTITIDYATGQSPAGTITVAGVTGDAVAAEIDTVQDGENDPLTLGALARWDLSTSQVFEGTSDPAEDGDAITQINDALSGGTKHLSDPGSGLRFIYRAGYQNGLPMAQVDNANDVMTSSLLRSDFGNAAWYLMVLKPAADGAPHEYCGLCNSFLGFHQWEIHKGADDKIFANGYDGTEHNAIADAAATATAMVVVAVFHRDRSVGSPNGFNELWINGVLQDRVAAGSPSINTNRPFFVGNNFYTGNFHWGEIIPFDGDPSADARITLASKIAMQKWGVS